MTTSTSESIPRPNAAADVALPAESDQPERVPTSPSSPAAPAASDTSPQQASVPQAGGNEVPVDQIKHPSEVNRDDPNINVVDLPPRSPTFKEQVYGYARMIRGTAFGQAEVKEQGAEVLRGERGIPLRRASQSSLK